MVRTCGVWREKSCGVVMKDAIARVKYPYLCLYESYYQYFNIFYSFTNLKKLRFRTEAQTV